MFADFSYAFLFINPSSFSMNDAWINENATSFRSIQLVCVVSLDFWNGEYFLTILIWAQIDIWASFDEFTMIS